MRIAATFSAGATFPAFSSLWSATPRALFAKNICQFQSIDQHASSAVLARTLEGLAAKLSPRTCCFGMICARKLRPAKFWRAVPYANFQNSVVLRKLICEFIILELLPKILTSSAIFLHWIETFVQRKKTYVIT
jgi:hypothetical protein